MFQKRSVDFGKDDESSSCASGCVERRLPLPGEKISVSTRFISPSRAVCISRARAESSGKRGAFQ